MFVLRKNAMDLNDQWLACTFGDKLAYVSLGLVFQYPESFRLKTFTYVGEAQQFIDDHSNYRSGICNDRTVICEAVFTPNGVTFQPIEAQQHERRSIKKIEATIPL